MMEDILIINKIKKMVDELNTSKHVEMIVRYSILAAKKFKRENSGNLVLLLNELPFYIQGRVIISLNT